MPRHNFDVIVIGLGATGSATLYHLAAGGARVLGIDQFTPPHAFGSSHGHTRIYRQAYYEAPEYVPLVRRALELWRALERDARRPLFANTGGLTIGPVGGELVSGALRSAREHGIAHELIDGADVAGRFPVFRAPDNSSAVFEPTAGVLFAEHCVSAHLDLARSHGSTIRCAERVTGVVPAIGGGAVVTTAAGTFDAARVVLAGGAWTPELAGLREAFRVTREAVHWFSPSTAHAAAGECPVAMIEYGNAPIFYSIPDFGDGFKAGLHRAGVVESAAGVAMVPTHAEREATAAVAAKYAPGGFGVHRASSSCYYTSTRDGHFVIGAMPGAPDVLLASACSGHGFKFSSALGEALARLATGRDAQFPATLFDPARLVRSQ